MRSCLLLLLAMVARATATLASPSLQARYIAGIDDQGQSAKSPMPTASPCEASPCRCKQAAALLLRSPSFK